MAADSSVTIYPLADNRLHNPDHFRRSAIAPAESHSVQFTEARTPLKENLAANQSVESDQSNLNVC